LKDVDDDILVCCENATTLNDLDYLDFFRGGIDRIFRCALNKGTILFCDSFGSLLPV